MPNPNEQPPEARRPIPDRLVHLVMDHLFYAARFPDRIAEAAKRGGVSREGAIASAIVDQIMEEFDVAEKSD